MNKNCIVIGDLNLDLILAKLKGYPELGKEVVSKSHFLDIGGSGGIFSAILSMSGIRTYIISKIGNDLFGNLLTNKLKSYKVDTSRIVVEKNKSRGTGITINLSYINDKYQISSLDLIRSLSVDEIMFESIKNVGHIHFSSYYMMSGLKGHYKELISNIKKNYPGVTISLDTNDDPEDNWDDDEIHMISKYIKVLLINEREALSITKESGIKNALNKLGKEIGTVIIKLGSRGYIAKDGKDYYSGKALAASFRDSTGAGDNFDAGFIYGLMNRFDIKKSLKIGNIYGAKSVEYFGGVGNKEKFSGIKKAIKEVI